MPNESTETEPTVKVEFRTVLRIAYGAHHMLVPVEEAKELAVLILQAIPASSVEQK